VRALALGGFVSSLVVGCGAKSGLDDLGSTAQSAGVGGGEDGAGARGGGGGEDGAGAPGGGAPCPRSSDAWSLALGADSTTTNIHAAVVDPAGDVVLLALIMEPVDLGCGVVATGEGNAARVLAKLDPFGNLLWYRTWKGNVDDYGGRVRLAVDDLGRIYVQEPVAAFGDASPSAFQGYLTSFDASGNRRWQRTLPLNARASSFSAAADGSLALGGYLYGDADFGLGTLSGDGSVRTSFFVRYDDAGQPLASTLVRGADGDVVPGGVDGLLLLPGGDVVTVAGGSGMSTTVLERLDPTGDIEWTRDAGAEGTYDTYTPWMLAQSGDAFLSAWQGAVESDSLATGETTWRVDATTPTTASCMYPPCGVTYADMTVRGDGSSVLVGWLAGSATIGGATVTAVDGQDALLVALSTAGAPSPMSFHGAAGQRIESVSVDPRGFAVITGTMFDGTLDLGPAGSIASTDAMTTTSFVARVPLP
jgi:hypothetical protein